MVLNATLILHGISGLRGELLSAIGWDPRKGETYTRFANDPYLKTLRELDAAYEDLDKTREESSKAFQNLIKTLLPNANKPSNAPITNIHKVIPVTSCLDDASLENMLEAKPLTEAERGKVLVPLKKAKIIGYRVKEENQKDKNSTISNQNHTSEIPMVMPVFHTRTSGVPEIPRGTPIHDARLDNLEVEMGIPKDKRVGITTFTLNDEITSYMEVTKETWGVLVIDVFPNSIAEKAGLKTGTTPAVFDGTKGMVGGDIINGIEDIPLKNTEDLKHYLSKYHIPGTKIRAQRA